ncbi:hypothetical protein PPL_01203 [Heterostelium album PN500]|uniref:Choline transporter-like protein n=1 Tax=Heterostelium pallidum (strain ATCC 26659 / Pp 5 / PN500) TaxID=670386 RepID=D3AYE3_HETP5|nr:hypothetical protein PPL_01203 [Heterostelium album PN500]EFA85970.1 hypothetical protein PPL_01203 [Heterostelium album PN500]|eukprot:XP_020438076.1 hypothetical protein PPL_01203 [Heterostelium album PN500]
MGNLDDDVPVSGNNQSYQQLQQPPAQQQPYDPQQPMVGNPYNGNPIYNSYFPPPQQQQQQPQQGYQQPIYQPPQQQQQQQPAPYQHNYYAAPNNGAYNVAPTYQNQQYDANQPLLGQQQQAPPQQMPGAAPGMVPIMIPPQQFVYHETEAKFPVAPKRQDVLYTVLFVVHLTVFAIIFFISLGRHPYYYYYNYNYSYSYGGGYGQLILSLFVSVVVSALYIYGWLKLAQNHARPLILYTFIANIVLTAVMMIVAFALGNIFLGIILVISVVVLFVFFLVWRKRIDFTAALLTTSVQLLQRFPAAFRIGFYSMAFNFVWLILWTAAVSRIYWTFSDAGYYFLSIYMVFSFYWVTNVIKNVVHTTVSGLFASWYFLDGSVGMGPNPTLGSFRRAMTTSFGSICFGSLLIAIISTMRYMANQLQSSDNGLLKFVGCILSCILSIMQSVVQFINVYAYTQVAIYGKSYCDAAKDTFELFKNRGADLVVNDNFISTALSMSVFLAGMIGCIFGVIVSQIGYSSAYGGVFAFFTTLSFVLVALEVVYSGVVTTFVCFMMEPNILAQNQPEIYNLYTTTYNKLIL